jgi:phage tail tape-measure protein
MIHRDDAIRSDVRTRVERVTRQVGDVVQWLRTEVIPESKALVRGEARTREQEDTEIRTQVQREVRALERADSQLGTSLATLGATVAGPVMHATRKVQRTEGFFDGLLNAGLPWLAILAIPDEFMRLVTTVLGRVAGQTGIVLEGLLEAADRAADAIE